jgi:ribosomal-protein-alanine N-acetyltransferase
MMQIRAATPADLPAIQRITAASPTAPQWTAMQFRESIGPPTTDAMRRAFLIAEATEASSPVEAIGFAIVSALVSVYPIEAELESIAVHPSQRGQGTGAALLRAAADWLTSLHTSGEPAAVLRLEVRVSNLGAISLYRSHGFAEVATRAGYYANPQEDAICMESTLFPLPHEHRTP